MKPRGTPRRWKLLRRTDKQICPSLNVPPLLLANKPTSSGDRLDLPALAHSGPPVTRHQGISRHSKGN